MGTVASGAPSARYDAENAEWIASLAPDARGRDAALERLHTMLLRAARVEVGRRAPRARIAGPEADDLAHQAAADALVAIVRRLPSFRGDSRFTTWAYKFVILDVSSKLGRHFWRRPEVAVDPEQWDKLPSRLGVAPDVALESRELFGAVRAAVDVALTAHQREVFVALVVHGIPLDALAVKLSTNRNAIYKVMFDARRKIRAALVTDGYLSA